MMRFLRESDAAIVVVGGVMALKSLNANWTIIEERVKVKM